MEVGYTFEPLEKEEITLMQLVRYAGASGDFNRIHTDVQFAEAAGLGGVIAHGMLVMGFVGQAIGQWFSIKDLAKYRAKFKSMTRTGEKITVQGRIVDENENYWICEAEAINQHAEVKLQAFFEVKK